jgi:nanoRNase/pAp phosphatase (c-di-AMP/oligoRNAs hydrolase)
MGTHGNLGGRLEAFRSHILPAESALIVTHDYPDPDCIASAAGLARLFSFWGVKNCVIAHGGFVGRPENKAMVRLLDLSLSPLVLVNPARFTRRVLVDAVPGGGNMSLPPETPVDAVFDHHQGQPVQSASCYMDIRQDIGATSSIITMYLLAAGCPIPPKLATALFYGIKTDTGDMEREAYPEDLACYRYLFDLMDYRLLAQIEKPPRGIEFYRCLNRAIQSFTLHGNVGIVALGPTPSPDSVAEMADFFHRLEILEWTACYGIFDNALFFSIRSKVLHAAGKMAARIGKELGGSGGGHGKIGAGKVEGDKARLRRISKEFEQAVVRRLGGEEKGDRPFWVEC